MPKLSCMLILAGSAMLMALPAVAQAKKAAPLPSDPRIGLLERQLRDVQQQLGEIKKSQGATPNSATVTGLKHSTSDRYTDLKRPLDSQTKVTMPNGRLTVASPDGAFTLTLRSLIQFDAGYFMQGKNPPGVDLNSGTNFRRAQFGFVGTAWKDWSYNFTYDFGGNGIEKPGYIYYAYIEYDGLKPFGFRIGALAPPEGIEDQTGSADLLFLERPASADVARDIAAGSSRKGASIFAQGETYFASLAWTGGKVGDPAVFDAQQALVARTAWLAVSNPDMKWLVDGHVSHVLKVADRTASTATTASTISFSNGPELAVDATETVNTGSIDARRVTEFGFETAVSYAGFYGQGGQTGTSGARYKSTPYPILFVQAGTATSVRNRGEHNAWNLLHVTSEKVSVDLFSWNAAERKFAVIRTDRFNRSASGWFASGHT